MSDEKTEKPTPKRLKKEREKGNIARSRDLVVAAASIAAAMAIAKLGGRIISELATKVAADLGHLGDAPLHELGAAGLTTLVLNNVKFIAILIGPIALATMAAGVGVNVLQGGVSFRANALSPRWERLNPAEGLKKLGFKSGGIDTIKTILTVVMIAYVSWQVVTAAMTDGWRLPWMAPLGAAEAASAHLNDLLWNVAWGLAIIAVADYGVQRYRWMTGMKMTKQEIKDESQESEGSAEVKAKVKRVQRDMSRRRMLNDVQRATVVITNPTHFAVALEYRRGMGAPLVLAKGQDYIALNIRERAKKHGIPIVENKPLARALYSTAEVGDTIPGPLFAAVAEVLAQLIRLKQLML